MTRKTLRCLANRVVLNQWTWVDMQLNLWNHELLRSTWDYSSWLSICNGIRCIFFTRYRTPVTCKDDSHRSRIHKHPICTLTPIHVHCELLKNWTIPAGLSDTPGVAIVKKWLQEQYTDFWFFNWPPQSLYMNIIEHIRDAWQGVVWNRSSVPHTPMDFRTALRDSWCELSPRDFSIPFHIRLLHFDALVWALSDIRVRYQVFLAL